MGEPCNIIFSSLLHITLHSLGLNSLAYNFWQTSPSGTR